MKQLNQPLRLTHTLEPIYFSDSEVLILGSFPSPKSREYGFYYGHPQNRFWDVISFVFQEEKPQEIMQKIDFLKRHHIALWDVIESCTITGAADSSIENPIPNDIGSIMKASNINLIFTTGATAHKLYYQLIYPNIQLEAKKLPSTSPANCRMSFQDLIENYVSIKEYVSH